jgi:hypothetical protein
LSGILKHITFRKLNLFPYSGEGMGDTYSVGSVRNHWTPDDGQSTKPSNRERSSEQFISREPFPCHIVSIITYVGTNLITCSGDSVACKATGYGFDG